jgi:hypothetical protein
MKKWGLGIEHEMRIRFKKNVSDISKNVRDTLFPNIKNEYIFIHSTTLLYYFRIHELSVMRNYEKYVSTDDEKLYLKKILLKKDLLDKVKNKVNFPLEDRSFFDIYSGKEKIDYSLKLLSFYLNLYCLYHAPLLFFTYNFNNETTMSFNEFINYDKILYYVYNEEDKSVTMNLIEEILNNLYNNIYELEAFKYLKELFKKKSVEDFFFTNIDINYINIDIIYGDNSKFDVDHFFNKINKYIVTIREIYNLNNLIIEGINDYKFYKNLYLLYNYEIPEIDYTYLTTAIEFKTINYDSINYEKTLNDLIELEKSFFYIINNLPIIKNLTDIFGELIYHNIGSVKDSITICDIINIYYYNIKEDYTGSYHIWITAPYNYKMTMKTFTNIHSTLANKLQLLEPILAAHYSSPSYNSISNITNSKSSLRQFLNGYSNYGTTDISLMNGSNKHIITKYYLSENDILNNKEPIVPYSNNEYPYQSRIYDMKGNLIINYNKLETRNITNNLFKLFNKGNEESEDINIQNYFSLIFEKTKIRPKMSFREYKYLKLGSDIRTRNLSNYFYPLDKNWKKCLIMKKNKLYEVYYNKNLNKISHERIYDKNIHKNNLLNRVGIEFRIFDHFPTSYLNQILGLLVPIVLDSTKNSKIIKFKNTYVAKQFWHDEMFNVINNGYQYNPSLHYINILEKEFNIHIEHKKSLTTENILLMLYNNLCKKYSNSRKNSLYNMMRFRSEIKFVNFNKKAWYDIINKYFEDNPQKLRQILYYNKNINNNNLLEILGKKYNYDLNKIKNYLVTFDK